jgi:hypothetical protein
MRDPSSNHVACRMGPVCNRADVGPSVLTRDLLLLTDVHGRPVGHAWNDDADDRANHFS